MGRQRIWWEQWHSLAARRRWRDEWRPLDDTEMKKENNNGERVRERRGKAILNF